MRPGRIDQHAFLDFPDKEERKDILRIYLKNFELDNITEEEIAEATEFYTASDLVSLLKEIHI